MNERRHWGPTALADGRTCFTLWAPACEQVHLRVTEQPECVMERQTDGWHAVTLPVPVGSQYCFRLPDGTTVADPASRFQPDGVWGKSELVALEDYAWASSDWQGRPWHEAVIYELHVGTFTPAGTFRAAIDKLSYLATLGVTAIELMPIAAFAGSRNWGYDGVFTYAPAASYGRPEDLQALIDAAHDAGIMVFLDVVYNHFGPEGNVMSAYAPAFFTERHHTPWGAGFNFDGEPAVRQFFIENALHWLRDYRVDGLRLDAVHAIADDSAPHIIDAIAAAVRAQFPERAIHLLLENEHNEAHRLVRDEHGPVLFTAQWNDDLHHVLHVAATREDAGYYADYQGDLQKLARAIAEGFAYQGEVMAYRGSARGEPSAQLPPVAFVGFIQNHDQVGNRALGDRLANLAPAAAVRAVAAIYLLLPQIPMLFMGEEWGATQPFPFFCDFEGELGAAVLKGRREEFSRFPEFASPQARDLIPNPLQSSTRDAASLQWEALELAPHRESLDWYTAIIAVRHEQLVPRLPQIGRGGSYTVLESGVIQVVWQLANGQLALTANLGATAAHAGPRPTEAVLWQEGEWVDELMAPWSVWWSLGEPA